MKIFKKNYKNFWKNTKNSFIYNKKSENIEINKKNRIQSTKFIIQHRSEFYCNKIPLQTQIVEVKCSTVCS